MSPFRELFVEVPLALLEAAVLEAQQRRVVKPFVQERPQPNHAARLIRSLPTIAERLYGWTRVESLRSAYDDAIDIHGIAACGHEHIATVSAHVALACGDAGLVGEAVCSAIESAHRICSCVPRPEHA